MAILPLTILCVLVTFSTAAKNPIRKHPDSVLTTEGSWAEFSCDIKLPGSIKQRIGDFTTRDSTEYNDGGKLPELEGVTAKRNSTSKNEKRMTETISILATENIDGTPVHCMFVDPSNDPCRNRFSMFALLNVQLPLKDLGNTNQNV